MSKRRIKSDPLIGSKIQIAPRRTKSAPPKLSVKKRRSRADSKRITTRRVKSEVAFGKFNKENPYISLKLKKHSATRKKSKKGESDIYLKDQPNCSDNRPDYKDNCYLGSLSYQCLKKNKKGEQANTVENPNKKDNCYDRNAICSWFFSKGADGNPLDPYTQKEFKDLDNWEIENCPQEYVNDIIKYLDSVLKRLLDRIKENKKLRGRHLDRVKIIGGDLLKIKNAGIINNSDIPTYVQQMIKKRSKEVIDKYIIILESLDKIKNADDLEQIFPYEPQINSSQGLVGANLEYLLELLDILYNNFDLFIESENRSKIPDKLWILLIKLHIIFRIAEFAHITKAFRSSQPEIHSPSPRLCFTRSSPFFPQEELPLTKFSTGLHALIDLDKGLVDQMENHIEGNYRSTTKKDYINSYLRFYINNKEVLYNLIHNLKCDAGLAKSNEDEHNRERRYRDFLEDLEYRNARPFSHSDSDYQDDY